MFLILMIFAFNCIMYIFTPMGVILQGLMVSIAGTYLVNYTYQTLVSGMIQGSEKVQKKILKHFHKYKVLIVFYVVKYLINKIINKAEYMTISIIK